VRAQRRDRGLRPDPTSFRDAIIPDRTADAAAE
jgi:hypothetical protein